MTTHEIGTLPDRWNITHLSGQRFYIVMPVLDGADAPVALADLTSVRAHVRPSIDSDQVLHRFDSTADPANAGMFDDSGARVWLFASAQETTDWVITWPGRDGQAIVWWDIEVVDTTGEPHQLTRPGTITLVHEVTR